MLCVSRACTICERWSEERCYDELPLDITIAILCSTQIGKRFEHLNVLIVRDVVDDKLYRALNVESFPQLEHIDLFRVKINILPCNSNVRSVTLRSCYYERREPYIGNDFPYPNARSLFLRSMISKITRKCRLPQLKKLEHLCVSDCIIDDKLSSNKYPRLRSLSMEGLNVSRGLVISRLKLLHRLQLSGCEQLPQMRNCIRINVLTLKRVRARDIYKLTNIEQFPELITLRIECLDPVDLRTLQPHSNLLKLTLKSTGMISRIADLTNLFRQLTELNIEDMNVDSGLPVLDNLKIIKGITIQSRGMRKKLLRNCPQLELLNGEFVRRKWNW